MQFAFTLDQSQGLQLSISWSPFVRLSSSLNPLSIFLFVGVVKDRHHEVPLNWGVF